MLCKYETEIIVIAKQRGRRHVTTMMWKQKSFTDTDVQTQGLAHLETSNATPDHMQKFN